MWKNETFTLTKFFNVIAFYSTLRTAVRVEKLEFCSHQKIIREINSLVKPLLSRIFS